MQALERLAFRYGLGCMEGLDDATLAAGNPSQPFEGAPPAPEEELPAGSVVADCVVERRVGQGSFGAVYAAARRNPPGRVAIKVLHGELSGWPKAVERFVREVNVVRVLRHPGIVEIHDLGKLGDGRPYYVMEYLDGEPLSALLRRRGRIPIEEAVELLEPVCAALEAAHEAGVIHRDVKAGNIMVTGEGAACSVKLLDFGMAKLIEGPEASSGFTTIGRRIGTMAAMAPEQILGGRVDARADVYALGILLYQLITGQHPFGCADEVELAWRHIEEPVPRPSARAPVTALVDTVVLRSLEKAPERRFPSSQAFFAALSEAAGGRRASASAGATEAMAAGVLVELDIDVTGEELDAAQLKDIARTLDLAEDTLRAAGFVIALATGGAVLAVRPLPEEATAAGGGGKRQAEEVAASLARALAGRAKADPRVRPRVRAHAGRALIRGAGAMECLGGQLAEIHSWPVEVTAGADAGAGER